MAAPFSNLRSKLDRAVVAYLLSEEVANIVVPARNSVELDLTEGPLVTVKSHAGHWEANIESGVWRLHIEVAIYGIAAPQPGVENLEAQRVQFDQVIAATGDALYSSSDNQADYDATALAVTTLGRALAAGPDAANNADMVDFTCQEWYPDILDAGHQPTKSHTIWKEIIGMVAICNASNVS